jgi:ATP-dependent DNA helicase RecQ
MSQCPTAVKSKHQLLQAGLVRHDGQCNKYSLTPSAWPVLKGDETFEGRIPWPKNITSSRSGRSGRSGRKSSKNTGLSEKERELFELLRAKRKTLVDKKGGPPHVVFSDPTLIKICQQLPTNLTAFNEVHGVDQKKLTDYGKTVLAVMKEWQG